MANQIKIKRGAVATIPTAATGEPLFTTDTKKLYVGNGVDNTIINPTAIGSLTGDVTANPASDGAATAATIAAGSIDNNKVSASAAIARSKLAALTASRAMVTDASGFDSVSAVTSTELGYLSGVTSAVQTQIDAKIAKATFTTKGDLPITTAASTITRLPISGTDGFVLTEDSASAGGLKWAAATAAPSTSYELSNLGLATSVALSALTIALKQADGASNPSTGASAVKVGMRSSTLTSGLYNQRSATAATSLVISSGSTLGQINALAARLYIYLIDNAGTLELAVSNKLHAESQLISTTAEGGLGAADSASVMYSTTARTSVPFRLVGFLDNTQTTAGTWASAGTKLQVGNYGALASEPVAAICNTSSQVLGSGTEDTIIFTTKELDTHNAYSTSTGLFTAPIEGTYQVTASGYAGSRLNANYDLQNLIAVNSTNKAQTYNYNSSSTINHVYNNLVSKLVTVNAGDTITFKMRAGSTGYTLDGNAERNYISIVRIK